MSEIEEERRSEMEKRGRGRERRDEMDVTDCSHFITLCNNNKQNIKIH